MRQPVASIFGNLVRSAGGAKTHAVYRVEPSPGAGLIAELTSIIPSDFSLLRVARTWSLERYVIGMQALADVRHMHREALGAHLESQRRHLDGRVAPDEPSLYMSVHLPGGLRRPALLAAERGTRAQLAAFPGTTPAAPQELGWLVDRAFSRGLRDAPASKRWEYSINVGTRSLRIASGLGESYQAFLCVTISPGDALVPRSQAERLLAPVEIVDFPVDVAFGVRRTGAGPGRPPLLHTTISLCVSAPDSSMLQERIEVLRRKLRTVRLHRPPGDQLRLFMSHLPGHPARVPAYEDPMSPAELEPFLPQPLPGLGTDGGPYIGHTLGKLPRPVQLDPIQLSRGDGPCVLLAGAPGSGKTVCMQLVMYQAFLSGSLVCDVDARGDHPLPDLPGVREHARVVELSPAQGFGGALDPLRIAPAELRERLAITLLLTLLPARVPREWGAAVRAAVHAVAPGADRCGAVIDELERGGGPAREVAGALAAVAGTGLAALALGRAGHEPPELICGPATVVRLPELVTASAVAGAPDRRRLHEALQCLLALYALRCAGRNARPHAVLGLDEAGSLISSALGRALVGHLARTARERGVTVLLGSRALVGAEQLRELVSAWLCFRARSDREAAQMLRAVGHDDPNGELQRLLRSFPQGACLLRDPAGRLGPVQIEVTGPELREALVSRTRHRVQLSRTM